MPSAYPGDVWSFAGINLQNDTLRVQTIDGYTAVPPMRGTGFVRSSIPGEMFRGKIHGARVIGLGLTLFSRDEPPDPLLIHQNLDMLAKAFNTQYQTEQPLVQFHPDGSVRTAYAHCVGWNPKSTDDNTGAIYKGIAEFLMSDPYFYTASAGVTAHAPGSGIIINHPGTVRTHKLSVIFHAAAGVNHPTVTNTTNGISFTIPYVGSGVQSVEVDCQAFNAVVLGGANLIGLLTHSGDFPFMVLEPGNNSLHVTGCDNFDLSFAPAYI